MSFLFLRYVGQWFHTTGNGFAKAGLRSWKLSINSFPSKNHFRFFKITKNKKTKWFFATNNDETFNAREIHPRFCKTDVMWCGNFSAYFQQSDSVSSPLFSKILKIQREICKNQSDEIFRALNFKNFFGKFLRASFFQRFYFQEVVFQAEFYSAAWYSSVSFFSRRVSVSDLVSEISFFKSSPHFI